MITITIITLGRNHGRQLHVERQLYGVSGEYAVVENLSDYERVQARIQTPGTGRSLLAASNTSRVLFAVNSTESGLALLIGRRQCSLLAAARFGLGAGESGLVVPELLAHTLNVLDAHELPHVLALGKPANVVLVRIIVVVPVFEAAVAEEALDHVFYAKVVKARSGQVGGLLGQSGGPVSERVDSSLILTERGTVGFARD